MLINNPETMKLLVDEVRSKFSTESEIDSLTTARLPYLHAVLEETLRIFPPAPNALPRITPPEGNIVLGDLIPGNVSELSHSSIMDQILTFGDRRCSQFRIGPCITAEPTLVALTSSSPTDGWMIRDSQTIVRRA